MTADATVAIIPMKALHLAKSRLANRLTPQQRACLSLNMLKTVVKAALESPMSRVWVVGGGSTVDTTASHLGAQWFDDLGLDLNRALRHYFQVAAASELVPLYLPTDLPFLTSEDVSRLVDVSDFGQKLTLSPAHRDGGTNAILVPLGCPLRPELGVGSFKRHQDQAKALKVPVSTCDPRGLKFDLDTPDDLELFERKEPGLLDRLTGQDNSHPV